VRQVVNGISGGVWRTFGSTVKHLMEVAAQSDFLTKGVFLSLNNLAG